MSKPPWPPTPPSACSDCPTITVRAPSMETLPMPWTALVEDCSPPCWLRRNRPSCPLGRLNPGRVTGLTCFCARSGGSCAVMAMIGVAPEPTPVSATLELPPTWAEPWLTTLLLSSWLAVMLTEPAAWTIAEATTLPLVGTV
ncbi:hypothetical protein D9M68_794230 [compost metagenome]